MEIYEGSENSFHVTAKKHYDMVDQHKIRWTSDDESIATVDQDGNVTGVSAGTATITAHLDTKEGVECLGAEDKCEVTVKAYIESDNESKDKEESTSAVQGTHDEFDGGETVNGEGDEDSAAEEPDAENTPEQEHRQDQDLTMEGIGLAYGHYEGIKPQGDGAIPTEIDLYEDGTFRIYCNFDLFSPNSTEHTYTGTYTVDRINEDGHPVLLFLTDDREFEMIYDGRFLYHENFFFFIE